MFTPSIVNCAIEVFARATGFNLSTHTVFLFELFNGYSFHFISPFALSKSHIANSVADEQVSSGT
jgi:hypothetical protein